MQGLQMVKFNHMINCQHFIYQVHMVQQAKQLNGGTLILIVRHPWRVVMVIVSVPNCCSGTPLMVENR